METFIPYHVAKMCLPSYKIAQVAVPFCMPISSERGLLSTQDSRGNVAVPHCHFLYVFYFIGMGVLLVSVPVSTCMPAAWVGRQIPWNWSYGWLWVSMWVAGIKAGCSERVVSTLNHWAISISYCLLSWYALLCCWQTHEYSTGSHIFCYLWWWISRCLFHCFQACCPKCRIKSTWEWAHLCSLFRDATG